MLTTSDLIAWASQIAYAVALYLQLWPVIRTRSLLGLNFDFLTLQWMSYLLSTLFSVGVFSDSGLSASYTARYDYHVDTKEVLFSIHNLVLSTVAMYLVGNRVYARGETQTISWFAWTVTTFCVTASIAVAARHALAPYGLSEPVVYAFLYSEAWLLTFLKFIPQIVYQYERRSTVGFSVGFVLGEVAGTILALIHVIARGVAGRVPELILRLALFGYDITLIVQYLRYAVATSEHARLLAAMESDRIAAGGSSTVYSSYQRTKTGGLSVSIRSIAGQHHQFAATTAAAADPTAAEKPNIIRPTAFSTSSGGGGSASSASQPLLHVSLLSDDRQLPLKLSGGGGAASRRTPSNGAVVGTSASITSIARGSTAAATGTTGTAAGVSASAGGTDSAAL